MSNQYIDKAKGRAKEAVGALTGDRKLKQDGRIDQARSAAKSAVDSAKEAVDKVADAATHHKNGDPVNDAVKPHAAAKD